MGDAFAETCAPDAFGVLNILSGAVVLGLLRVVLPDLVVGVAVLAAAPSYHGVPEVPNCGAVFFSESFS